MLKVLFVALLAFSNFALANAKIAAALDGKYTYLAPDEDYKITRQVIEIKDGTINFPAALNTAKNIEIREGGQTDFIKALKGEPLPAGVSLYSFTADLQSTGEPIDFTLLKQTVDNKHSRITVYFADSQLEGPIALIQGYDNSDAEQMKALEQAEKELNEGDGE